MALAQRLQNKIADMIGYVELTHESLKRYSWIEGRIHDLTNTHIACLFASWELKNNILWNMED